MTGSSFPHRANGSMAAAACGNAGSRALSAEQYRDLFGGQVEERAGRIVLNLGGGIVGLAMKPSMGRHVVHALRRHEVDGPMIEFAGSRPRWVFLADPNGAVISSAMLPPGTELIGYQATVPLPRSGRSTRWVIPPARDRRWLPTIDAVIGSVRAVGPMHLNSVSCA